MHMLVQSKGVGQGCYLVKDFGEHVLVQDGDVLGAVRDQGGRQGVQDGQTLGHQPVLLQPQLGRGGLERPAATSSLSLKPASSSSSSPLS